MRPIFSWAVLNFGSFNPQILSISGSRYPIPTTEYLSTWCICPYQLRAAFWETRSFSWLNFPLTKGLRHIIEIPPIFSFFWKRYFKWPLGGSNVLEQTFVDDVMIPLLLSLLHTIVETARPYGWMRLGMLHQSIFHLDLFSFNPRLAGHFFHFA